MSETLAIVQDDRTCNTYNNNIVLMLFALFGLSYFAFLAAYTSFDNDLWFILASGREIIENGIPYTNPWSMHTDMAIVVQQWLSAVIIYAIYSVAGMTGTEILVFILIAVLIYCLYKLGREITNDKTRGGEIILAFILLAFLLMQNYMATRPHLYTMIAYTLILLILERYRKTNNWKVLIFLPIITLIHGNCHMAMAPLDLFLIGLYWLPNFLAPINKRFNNNPITLVNATYKRLPLLIALVISAFALLINPYGIEGTLYLINSYGAADYNNYIEEMNPLTLSNSMGWLYIVFLAIDCFALGKTFKNGINLPHLLLPAIMAYLALTHVRNVWLFPLFSLPLLFSAFGSYSIYTKKIRVFRSKTVSILISVCIAVFLFLLFNILNSSNTVLEDDSLDNTCCPQYGAVYISTYAQLHDLDQSNLKIYNSFNNGGYLEWKGFKTFMDPRPELWEPGISKQDKHYYQEYVDAEQKASLSAQLLADYTFDFLIVDDNSAMKAVLDEITLYTKVYRGNGYTVWASSSFGLPETKETEEASKSVRDVCAEVFGENVLKTGKD